MLPIQTLLFAQEKILQLTKLHDTPCIQKINI